MSELPSGVNVNASVTSVDVNVIAPLRVLKEVTAPVVLKAASSQAEPSQTYNWLPVLFQYKAPVNKALPSLSTEGAEDLDPR